MAVIELWIQIENRPWDASPNNIDRMMGQTIKEMTGVEPATVQLSATNTRMMFAPLNDGSEAQPDGTKKWKVIDGLILRRYKPPQQPDKSDAWTVPDDRKINPWDVNEQDPTDTGTMGTIPGPVIECNVGDSVVVHFRNMDMRAKTVIQQKCFDLPVIGRICFPIPTTVPFPIEKRCHSLHPHGFVFQNTSDGAYPLSPPDPTQAIPASEAAAWASVPKFAGTLKKGDRVPPGGTFDYHWNTLGWPTTAGVWLYHDHSICDAENVGLGAIGIIVIHNPADPEDVLTPDVPLFGSPVQVRCFPLPFDVPILPHQLETLGAVAPPGSGHTMPMAMHVHGGKEKEREEAPQKHLLVHDGSLLLEADKKLQFFRRICTFFYSAPPTKALYLQLYHELADSGVHINGRKYLGNTPTLIAGPRTKMRFGVVGMGSMFHTFHIHGHRWVIPGPDGNKNSGGGGIGDPNAIQNSALVKAVSQFEDTKIFGPANSFVLTIHEDAGEGSFMRAEPALGEWHMHCHVLSHMDSGMMGSLLVIQGGETVTQLPRGVPCDMPAGGGGMPGMKQVEAKNDNTNPTGYAFSPLSLPVSMGDSVVFKNSSDGPHSIVWDTAGAPANVPTFTAGTSSLPVVMSSMGTFKFHCGIHGPDMKGTIVVM
jgi:FtsP/CotA-like multicopper oxidase with cupredoxin domain/plastocyanin